MGTFLLTMLLTFVVVSVALLWFWRVGTPIYRVEKENVTALLELILSGQATESDWHVFAAYPIRQDDQLRRVQERCLAIAEREYIGGNHRLFTDEGLDQLREVLDELTAE